MKNDRSKELERRLESLEPNDKRKLYKRAAAMRRAACRSKEGKGVGRWRPEAGGDDACVERNVRRRQDSIHDWALRLLDQERAAGAPLDGPAVVRSGQVVWIGAGECTVESAGEALDCAIAAELAAVQQTALAVGDVVGLARPAGDRWVVASVEPRRTRLSRPDAFYGHVERVLVANVDPVCIVVSLRQPDFKPGLVDRLAVAVRRGGAEPLVVASKLDLLSAGERDAELRALEVRRAAGLAAVACSAATGEGIDALRQALAGRLTAFVGLSGAGKSSLLNALRPGLELKTTAVRDYDGRGRHTTTASTLYDLGDGIRAVDTPGIRSFGLWDLPAGELGAHFEEIAALAPRCRFRDCTHTHEPGCAVKEAVAAGGVSEERYATYVRILGSLAGRGKR